MAAVIKIVSEAFNLVTSSINICTVIALEKFVAIISSEIKLGILTASFLSKILWLEYAP